MLTALGSRPAPSHSVQTGGWWKSRAWCCRDTLRLAVLWRFKELKPQTAFSQRALWFQPWGIFSHLNISGMRRARWQSQGHL